MMTKSNSPAFLLGYDVESLGSQNRIPFEKTKKFLQVAAPLHQELHAPCTLFICGKTLENNIEEFQKVKEKFGEVFDFQQHTYSHLLLKTVVQENEEGITVVKSGTLGEIKNEVEKTSKLLKKYLDVNCIGLTGPYGYYRGLSDRLDILEILHDSGIRFVRTYARNEHDWCPVSFQIQPFWYDKQGFPEILEFPIQGWQDCIWRTSHGWNRKEEYLQYLKEGIDYIAAHNLTWCYAQHDWSSIREDPAMEITRKIIEYAVERGVRLISYLDYYRECLKTKAEASK